MAFFLIFTIIVLTSPVKAIDNCNNLDTEVLILGGGMAGVSAANRLRALGRNFLLFEAGQSVGGRMKRTEVFPGVFTSTGPVYIHGVDPGMPELHPIYKLMQNCGGLDGFIVGDKKIYEGSTDVTSLYERSSQIYEQACKNAARLAKERQEQNLPDISVGQALRQSGWMPQNPLEHFTEWIEFDFDAAVSPHRFSLLAHNQDTTYTDFIPRGVETGTDYLVTDSRGYVQLVKCLTSNFRSNRVHLNSKVTKILNNDNCVCIEVTQSNGSNRYCGRYAILTFSIGVIKSESFRSVLSPYFSQAKQQALGIFSMGHYLKIYLQFNNRFWDNDVTDIGRVDLQRGNYPLFTNAFMSSNVHVLILVLTEDMANEALAMDEQSLKNSITVALRDIYGNNVSSPTNIYRETYKSDQLFLGSYVVIDAGVKEDTYNVLQSSEMSLYLAGSGISKNYPGYVHGAYLSGINTAERVNRAILSGGNTPNSSHNTSFSYSVYIIMLVEFLAIIA